MAAVNVKLVRLAAAAGLALRVASPAAFGQRIDLDHVQAQEDFRLGVRAFHNGLLTPSLLYLEKALSLRPDEPLMRAWLGRAQYRAGLEEAALQSWRHLLDAGKGSEQLKSLVQGVEFRRGLGREMHLGPGGAALPDTKYVLAQQLDASTYATALFRRPSSVRARPDGTLLIVSFGSGQILVADVNHDIREVWKGNLAGLDQPFDVLETEDGSVFVSEYGANRIARRAPDGSWTAGFGSRGSGPGQLLGPQYLAADGRGYLYVSDWGNHRVSKFDYAGNFVLSFGSPGLAGPTGVAVHGDAVYVADRINRRIEVYDLSGNHLSSIGRGVLQGPEGLSFTAGPGPGGTLLVADANRIRTYDPEREEWRERGDLGSAPRRLTGVCVSANGETYAADFDRSRIFVLSEMSALYSGLSVQVERAVVAGFPTVVASVSVRDRMGRPVVGLQGKNFLLTENHRPVGEVTLVQRAPTEAEAVLVVEPSAAMAAHREDLRAATAALYDALRGKGGLYVVAAGERPSLEAGLASTRLAVLEAVERAAALPPGPFDRAVYRAVSELTPRHARRTVVYLTCGRPGPGSFGDYSLNEVTRCLANNGVTFHALRFDGPSEGGQPLPELPSIAGETGGGVYAFRSPEGVNPLARQVLERAVPLYSFRYTSPTFPEFGQKYIPLEVQVNLVRRSGRDELGYFAPISE